MSDDDRTTTTTQESSEAPGHPGSDEPKAGYPLSGEDEPQAPPEPDTSKPGYGLGAS